MALSLQTVKSTVEDRTGLSCSDFGGETALQTAVISATSEFSKRKSGTLYGFFNVLQNVTEYPFPSNPLPSGPTAPGFPANLVMITDVYFSPQSMLGNNLSFEDMLLQSIQGNVVVLDFGGNIFENPSLVQIWFQKLRDFRDTIGTPDWRIIDTSPVKTLQLLDAPDQNSTGYWEGRRSWLLSDIQPVDYEAFYKAVLWKLAQSRAMRLAVAKQYSEGSGGPQVQPAFDFWNEMAKQFKQEFFDEVGEGRGIITIG